MPNHPNLFRDYPNLRPRFEVHPFLEHYQVIIEGKNPKAISEIKRGNLSKEKQELFEQHLLANKCTDESSERIKGYLKRVNYFKVLITTI